MPPIQSPIEPGLPTSDQAPDTGIAPDPSLNGEPSPDPSTTRDPEPDPNAPLSFVPHDPPAQPGQPPRPPQRFRTNRYGELEEHELVRLLDTIEDERARGRFRESIYISLFFWLAVAWFVFYGPRVLWHAPVLINPADVLKQREFTQLNMPVLAPHLAKPAPKPAPLNRQTIKQLQAMTRETPTFAPTPPPPAPVATSNPPPPLPAAPAPRIPAASVPDAPTPQPTARATFPPTDNSPSADMRRALSGGRPGRPGDSGGSVRTSKGVEAGGGVEVLSDEQGVDFSAYLRRLHDDLLRNWEPLLPEETASPIFKKGRTIIILTLLPDGTIADMKLEGPSGDRAIDKSAWGSIISEGKFPPRPTQFHGPNFVMRWYYVVNGEQ